MDQLMHPSFLADPMKKREKKSLIFKLKIILRVPMNIKVSICMYVVTTKLYLITLLKIPALGPRLGGECLLGMQSLGFCPYYQTGKQQTVTNFPLLFLNTLKPALS